MTVPEPCGGAGPGRLPAGLADPLAHRPPGDSQGLCHVGLFPTFLDQFPSSQPTGFHQYPELFMGPIISQAHSNV